MFSASVKSRTSPRRCRSSGNVPDSLVESLARRVARDVLAGDLDHAALGLRQPGERVDQLGLAVAVDPGDADDLSRAHLERDVANGRQPALVEDIEVLHLEQGLPGLGRLLVHLEEDLPPDHQLGQLLLGRAFTRKRLDHLAAAENRHPVGDVEHLVQLVADEDDGHALLGEGAQDPEQLERLLGREHGGRLVEDQDLGSPVEGLQDLDALLLADADVLDARVRVDRELERLRDLLDPFLGCVLVEQHLLARGLDSQHDVLGDRHHRDQHEVLVDHADPQVDRVARRAHLDRLAVDQDLALVRPVEAVEDVHQRRLPGAVLAEQGVNLAAAQVEVDLVVRDHAREALRDALQLEEWRLVSHEAPS